MGAVERDGLTGERDGRDARHRRQVAPRRRAAADARDRHVRQVAPVVRDQPEGVDERDLDGGLQGRQGAPAVLELDRQYVRAARREPARRPEPERRRGDA